MLSLSKYLCRQQRQNTRNAARLNEEDFECTQLRTSRAGHNRLALLTSWRCAATRSAPLGQAHIGLQIMNFSALVYWRMLKQIIWKLCHVDHHGALYLNLP